MTVTISPADLDDPRVAALLDDHLAEMEPGVAPVVDAARALYTGAGFTPCAPFGAYTPDRHSMFLTRLL